MSNDAKPVDVLVGARIRLRRMLLGMSQESLGDAVGVTFQQIQKYERGANRIGASRLVQIAKALGVEPSYFFEGIDGEERNASGDGSTGADDAITTFLGSRDGVTLAAAWVTIEDPHMRRSLLNLVLAVAGERDGSASGKPPRRREVRPEQREVSAL